jgi:hypothetical protein
MLLEYCSPTFPARFAHVQRLADTLQVEYKLKKVPTIVSILSKYLTKYSYSNVRLQRAIETSLLTSHQRNSKMQICRK